MNSDKVPAEIVEAYTWGMDCQVYMIVLAVALRDERARANKLEWKANNHCITAERIGDGVTAYRTNFDDNDPRHIWTDEQWQAQAHKELIGE